MRYRYAGVIAINPNTDQTEIVKSATGTVHLNENWDIPVEVQDVNGFTMTTLNTTIEGLFPDFYVEDQPVVGFQTSSGHRFYLRSSTPVPGPPGPSPVSIGSASGVLTFEYPDGTVISGPLIPTSEELGDVVISDLLSSPTTAAGAAVQKKVAEAVAADETVHQAAAAAVDSALGDASIVRGAVRGADPIIGDDDAPVGGFLGENGRTTDLVVNKDGKVPQAMLDEWMDRGGAVAYLEGKRHDGPAGGLVGENGRETDLVLDDDGHVMDDVLADWSRRMSTLAPVAAGPTPAFGAFASRGLMVRDRDGRVIRQTSLVDVLAAWGDSLTDGWPKPPFAADQSDAWPAVLAGLLGKPVYNGGKSGQSADEIALRQGGLVLNLTPNGGTIPVSGSVTVTTAQAVGWRLDRSWSCTGTLAGVHGTLSRSASTLTFTRTTAGDAVAVTGAAPFLSEPGATYADATSIFMLGRNDIGYTGVPAAGPTIERIVSANVAAVRSLTPANPRFLLLGTLNATGEGRSSSNWTTVTTANDTLAKLYPDNYLDIRHYIVHESIYDQSLTPTTDDLAKIAADAPPPSIMVDSIHYTPATAASIARRIHTWLTEKNWS